MESRPHQPDLAAAADKADQALIIAGLIGSPTRNSGYLSFGEQPETGVLLVG
jgi:hypothetical protein